MGTSGDSDIEAVTEVITITPDDAVKAIGFHRRQVAIVLLAGFSYAFYAGQCFIQPITSEDVWREWPTLKNTNKYAVLFFVTGSLKLVGAIFLVPLQDILGRRILLVSSLILTLIFAAIAAGAVNFTMHVIFRALTYLFLACIQTTQYVYVLEMVPMRSRTLPPVLTTAFGTVGLLNVTICWWQMDSLARVWRWTHLCACIPGVIAAFVCFLVPYDTPKMYCMTGRPEKAWKVLNSLHPKGEAGLKESLMEKTGTVGKNVEFKLDLGKQMEHGGRRCYDILWNMVKISLKREGKLMIDKKWARVVWPVVTMWLLQSIASWGVTSYLPSYFDVIGIESHVAMVISFAFEFPGLLIAYCFMIRLGRVVTLRIYTTLATAILVTLAIAAATLPKSHWFLWIPTATFYLSCAPIWTLLYTYSPEVFPADVRGAAMGLVGVANGAPQIFTYFIAQNVATDWLYPTVWGSVYALLALLTYFGLSIETAPHCQKRGSMSGDERHESVDVAHSDEKKED